MSGDSEIPPTYYFSGITFNPTFYSSASSDYLTASTGKKIFLSYPTAQGTETITSLKSSSIEPTSSTLDIAVLSTSSTVNIGTSTARTGSINIGNSATTGLGNNIGIGSALSNTSIAGKYVELAASTNGISLNTSGNMDLIATAYNIGTTLVSNTNINIGTATKTTTTINGNLSLTNPLTLPTTSVTPSSTQLGYFAQGQLGYTQCNSTGVNLAVLTGIAIGRYLVIMSYGADTWSTATMTLALTITTTNGSADVFNVPIGAGGSTNGYTSGSMTGIGIITTTSGTFQIRGTTSVGTVNCYSNIKIFRIE